MEKAKERFKKHSIIYTILLVPLAGAFLFIIYLIIVFGIINYADRHQFDKESERTAKIIPFSQRGLPLPETDIPVTLPTDPGEAGKATLAGIDSDNDGVRDDLQREIVYMYPQNQQVRRVLTAMVKKGQDVITTEGDHEHFKQLMLSYFALEHCYSFLMFGAVNVDRDYTYTDILWNMLKNTPWREKTFEENDNKGKPYIVTIDISSEACLNLNAQGQY